MDPVINISSHDLSIRGWGSGWDEENNARPVSRGSTGRGSVLGGGGGGGGGGTEFYFGYQSANIYVVYSRSRSSLKDNFLLIVNSCPL